MVNGAPPVVLQYADNTLIILRADPAATARLQVILDLFAAATWLVINFSKSTLVPMHVDPGVLAVVVGPFQCNARLLSPAGRLVLINAVLDSIPTYAMAATRLPPLVFAALDKLRRAFLWNVADWASGAQCLVAWEHVCRSEAEGGLGVRALEVQNECLLLKLLHRFHSRVPLRWASWVWGQLGRRSLLTHGRSPLEGEHWHALEGVAAYLPLALPCAARGWEADLVLERWVASLRAAPDGFPRLVLPCDLPEDHGVGGPSGWGAFPPCA
ncbi:hypothetical protein D1007_35870 [Hordeum vulgare]|nr:hypothetical protein D1007_35870 [Hordeum vulgare]